MAYDENLADRLRDHLAGHMGISERRMFGGICFMLDGNMVCGVINEDLMLRVGPDTYESTLALDGARPMDFTGKSLKGFVYVDGAFVAEDADLAEWVGRGLVFAAGLPPK
ncbi:MAG: TfoX/Sxy family protein [Rhodospirillales bacterium]|nr:TfoX/Sxy family protein [Rhodospirillales bacterium]